jgi:hypothetical protein
MAGEPTAARRGVIAIVVVSLLAAAGCGNPTVDTKTIEKGIQQQVVAGGTSVTNVDCPSNVKSEKGATFQCGVSFSNGATGKVEVTQAAIAHYQYALVPGSLQVPGSALEQEIEKQLSQQGVNNASVNCPDNIIVKVGTYVVCDVTGANGGKGTVKFTFSDASGTVDTSSVETTS